MIRQKGEEGINALCQPRCGIGGNGGPVLFRQPAVCCHQVRDTLFRLRPAKQHTVVFTVPVGAFQLHALAVKPGIQNKAACAAYAEMLAQPRLPLLPVWVGGKEAVHIQTIVMLRTVPGQHIVDLVLCNEAGAWLTVFCLDRKFPHGPCQHFHLRPQSGRFIQPVTHEAVVAFIGAGKGTHFLL